MNEVEAVCVESESVINIVELGGYESVWSSRSMRPETLIRGEEHGSHQAPRLHAVPEV